MVQPKKIRSYFAQRSYPDVVSLLEHVSELSRQITRHPFQKSRHIFPKKPSEFHLLVRDIVSQFPGYVSPAIVAREVIKREKGKIVEKPDKRTYMRVSHALFYLRKFGLIAKPTARPKVTRLDDLSRLIIEIAPKFRTREGKRYNHVEIARKVASKQGKNPDEMSDHEFAQLHAAVTSKIGTLVAGGHIARTGLFLGAPRLRTATLADVQKHHHLISEVLRSNHSYVRGWRDFLDESKATLHGESALSAAIAKFDETRGVPFELFAKFGIRRRIHDRLCRLRRKKKPLSLDAPLQHEARSTMHDKLGRPAFEPEILQTQAGKLLALHKRRLLGAHHLALWALERFGHSQQEMASFFGTSREAVRRNILMAKKRLK